ncbi:homeobox protein onecut isoform X5 [Zootermopsis nevadensis]|uniref:homeobox protein onecut isoform X5 n=1 Tax=Zootermopsis nevadensis TaxID=136037 RepID=UPI000B8EAB74|nr:homeobox protein onecut isoform X5 [Zootermopsis nevadensis]XP_021922473.1 homeobox protein onecut isoform X5 [Zootermopsis nevadensis]
MENMGEMAEQHSLSEPLPETVDSPVTSTHAGLSMSPTELSPTISRSALAGSVPTSHESLTESGSGAEHGHIQIKEELPTSAEDLSAEGAVSVASDTTKHESLSVIVQAQDDSHDSELLSPGKLSPTSGISVSVASMIDATDFRSLQPEPTYQTLTSVNGRMSPPGFSPSSSYATLTPLQPLPPISTMSDKFAYGHASNVSGSFTVMQNNGLGNIGLGMGVNSPYSYEKLQSMSMSPPHHYSSPNNGLSSIGIPQQHSPLSPQSSYSQNGLHSPQKSMSPNSYDSPYTQRDLVGRATLVAPQSPTLSPPSASLHSPPNTIVTSFGGTATSLAAASLPTINGLTTITPHASVVSPHHSPPSLVAQQIQREAVVVASPSPPSYVPQQQPQPPPQTPVAVKTVPASSGGGGGGVGVGAGAPAGAGEVEEINTKELAQRISAELKRYSIPQAIFAQRVLCRSQGTLSDLLRNPKPWSKLKSGRETFRRMWKWLQEPEFQRMSALRLAGKCWNSPAYNSPWNMNTVDFIYNEDFFSELRSYEPETMLEEEEEDISQWQSKC